MNPETRKCPVCGNPTLIFMSQSMVWQCVSIVGVPNTVNNISNTSITCGYSERYDSLTAILRGMVFYLNDIVKNLGSEDQISARLAKNRDEIADVLADRDTINMLERDLEKNRS